MSETIPVVCRECETQPVLIETPYSDVQEYAVVCDCNMRGIDVSDCVSSSNLMQPPTGKWYNIDHNYDIGG